MAQCQTFPGPAVQDLLNFQRASICDHQVCFGGGIVGDIHAWAANEQGFSPSANMSYHDEACFVAARFSASSVTALTKSCLGESKV
jgi:hypothetical protein